MLKKKKLLFVINTLGRAGAETALLELLRRIDPEQYEVSLFVLLNQGEMVHELPEYVRLLNPAYCDSSVLEQSGRRILKRQIWRQLFSNGAIFKNGPYLCYHFLAMAQKGCIQLDKLLWMALADGAQRWPEEHYDLAVSYLEGGSTYYVARHVSARCKVAFVHTDYTMAGYNRSLDRDSYAQFEHLYAVSDEARTSFLQSYPEYERRMTVFPNLINQTGILEKAKQEGGFTDGYEGFRILTVGRLISQKALDVSVEAMKLLKEQGRQVRWYILGDGDQREMLTKLIAQLRLEKDFILLGHRPNPYPYYRQADLYVHASRVEGKSIAIQEAQILGCPILVSNCSGNREQVTDGVDGEMCDLNARSICEHIMKLMDDEETRKRYGRLSAEKRFSEGSRLNELLAMAQQEV